jgi:hypothetical protein
MGNKQLFVCHEEPLQIGNRIIRQPAYLFRIGSDVGHLDRRRTKVNIAYFIILYCMIRGKAAEMSQRPGKVSFVSDLC